MINATYKGVLWRNRSLQMQFACCTLAEIALHLVGVYCHQFPEHSLTRHLKQLYRSLFAVFHPHMGQQSKICAQSFRLWHPRMWHILLGRIFLIFYDWRRIKQLFNIHWESLDIYLNNAIIGGIFFFETMLNYCQCLLAWVSKICISYHVSCFTIRYEIFGGDYNRLHFQWLRSNSFTDQLLLKFIQKSEIERVRFTAITLL